MIQRRPTFWTVANGFPGVTAGAAEQAEADGWDGVWVPDSQNLTGDPYVALALAAARTRTLLLGTGVTNPLTRHPAVTAMSIATVHEESGGRAVLGIGRGDSALAYLGMAPAPVAVFAAYLDRVQGYLRREEVPFDVEADGKGVVADAASLRLAAGPKASQLRWLLHGHQPKVSMEVVASGPKVIAVGATRAERLTLAVGADPKRVRWGIDVAKTARIEAGLDPDSLEFGALVPVSVNEDVATARRLMADSLPGIVRFSVMHGSVVGPVDEKVKDTMEKLHRTYDMNHHARHGRQTEFVSEALIDAFAITGAPGYCTERLLELKELGISIFHLHGNWFGADPELRKNSWDELSNRVLPAIR
jgi:5,10-methylenetetrahydromethanopterin reductase